MTGRSGGPSPARRSVVTRPRLRSKHGRESFPCSRGRTPGRCYFLSPVTVLLLRATSLMKSVTTKASSANGAE